MKYYDITFHELSGKNVIKRSIPSDKENFSAWEDACVAIEPDFLHLLVDQYLKQHGLLRKRPKCRLAIS